MVFGSRVKLLGRKVERHAMRHYLEEFLPRASLVLQMAVYDTQCGAKVFRAVRRRRSIRRTLLQPVGVRRGSVRPLHPQLGSSSAAAARIYEFPLMVWRDVAGSKVKQPIFLWPSGHRENLLEVHAQCVMASDGPRQRIHDA